MSTQIFHPHAAHRLPQLLLGLLLAIPAGCGGDSRETVLDARGLLERYERDRRRHDPVNFSEVDLGEFTVTQRQDPSIFYIRFHIFAVVPDSTLEHFNELIQTRGERVRARVREAVQRSDLDDLNDPSLGWLKSELIVSINRGLQTPILRDVVFSAFSLERG